MTNDGGTARIGKPRAALLLTWAALALAGVFALRQLATWPTRLRYPGEEDIIEGIPLAEMLHLRQGVPIYAPLSPQRFDSTIYGPLYYLAGKSLISAGKPAYAPLRVVSMLATLGCAAGCALLAFWVTQTSLAAVLAPLLFFGYGFVTRHGTSARSDTGAFFLALAGFLIAYRSRNGRVLLLSTPLFLASFFYKQQFVAAPVSILIYLLWERRYRLAGEFAGLLAAGGLTLLALFQFMVFRGQAFLLHFVFYNLMPYDQISFLKGWMFFGLVLLIPLLVGLHFLRKHPDRLLGCYLGCAVFLSLAMVARAGSDNNYFFECVAIMSALFAAQIAASRGNTWAAATTLGLLVVVTLFQGLWPTRPVAQPEDFARDRALQRFLRTNFPRGTPALGYYVGDLVRAGLDTPFPNVYHFRGLVLKGVYDEKIMIDQLRAHRYGVVLLDFDLRKHSDDFMANYYLTAGERSAILRHYQVAAVLPLPRPEKTPFNEAAYIYVPRERPGS